MGDDIVDNAADITSLNATVVGNADDISENAADIADNTADIASFNATIIENAENIDENADDIAENSEDISVNAEDIASLNSTVVDNAEAISQVESDLDDNTADDEEFRSFNWTKGVDYIYDMVQSDSHAEQYELKAKLEDLIDAPFE